MEHTKAYRHTYQLQSQTPALAGNIDGLLFNLREKRKTKNNCEYEMSDFLDLIKFQKFVFSDSAVVLCGRACMCRVVVCAMSSDYRRCDFRYHNVHIAKPLITVVCEANGLVRMTNKTNAHRISHATAP